MLALVSSLMRTSLSPGWFNWFFGGVRYGIAKVKFVVVDDLKWLSCQFLNIDQIRRFGLIAKSDGDTISPGTACPTYAVHITLGNIG